MGKERPILMSAPMVRAILAGTKTQTRRVIAKISAPSPMEAHAAEAPSKTNPVLPGDKLPLTSGDAEADAVIAMDRAAKLLEKSAEPFDSACRILRDFVHAFTVRRLGNPLGGDPYAQKMTGGDAERRVVEAAKVYVKAIRDTGIDDEEQSRRYGILEEAVDALAQPTPAPEAPNACLRCGHERHDGACNALIDIESRTVCACVAGEQVQLTPAPSQDAEQTPEKGVDRG